MNAAKRMIWIGLAALLVFGASAALAQDSTTPAAPGDGNPPPGWTGNPPPDGAPVPPDGTLPEPPEDGTLPNPPPRPPAPAYTYTASLTCSTATRLEGEAQGEVAQSYSSLRESIGSSEVLAVMPGGAVFSILDGPVCSGGYNWYHVSYNGVEGWVTEGYAGDYWLEPVNLD
ncbi:MAG: SH3 domain-containing protein [Anaerolineae bacterium]